MPHPVLPHWQRPSRARLRTGIDRRSLHRAGMLGRGVRVGIVDAGLATRTRGTKLWQRVASGQNFVAGEPGDAWDETLLPEHGTLIAAVIHDLAPAAELLVARACPGSHYNLSSWLVQALAWLHSQGAHVITLSAGSEACPDADCHLCRTVRWLTDRQVVVVAASGSELTGRSWCPARLPEVLRVGPSFPGEPCPQNVRIPCPHREGIYVDGCYCCGSSFSAAVVAGMIAAISQAFPPTRIAAAVQTMLENHQSGADVKSSGGLSIEDLLRRLRDDPAQTSSR